MLAQYVVCMHHGRYVWMVCIDNVWKGCIRKGVTYRYRDIVALVPGMVKEQWNRWREERSKAE